MVEDKTAIDKGRYKIPVLLLTFNRLDLVRKQLLALQNIRPDRLYISSDGPRNKKEQKVIEFIRWEIDRLITWECKVYKKYEEQNLGCGRGVSSAISWFFHEEEMGVILEDDCLVSQSFFLFCEELLNKYKNDKKIAGITADFKFIRNELDDAGYGYIDFPLIWGWASWRRVWNQYSYNLEDFDCAKKNINFLAGFNKKAKKYWLTNWQKIKNHKVDTWDYQFSYLILKQQMQFIHPMRNMVKNIGFGDEATHTKNKNDPTSNLENIEISAGPYREYINYKKYNVYLKNEYFIRHNFFVKILKRYDLL